MFNLNRSSYKLSVESLNILVRLQKPYLLLSSQRVKKRGDQWREKNLHE